MNLKHLLKMISDRTVYIDTQTIKWGGEYDGGEHHTTHTRVRVGSQVVSYDYQGVRGLIQTLQLLPDVTIIINGEPLDEIRFSSTKNS